MELDFNNSDAVSISCVILRWVLENIDFGYLGAKIGSEPIIFGPCQDTLLPNFNYTLNMQEQISACVPKLPSTFPEKYLVE